MLPYNSQKKNLKTQGQERRIQKAIFFIICQKWDREKEWQARPLRLSLGVYPLAHLNMVLGRGGSWVLTFKQGRFQPLYRDPLIFLF